MIYMSRLQNILPLFNEISTYEETIEDNKWNRAKQEEIITHQKFGAWNKRTLRENKTQLTIQIRRQNGSTKQNGTIFRSGIGGRWVPWGSVSEFYAPLARMTTVGIL